MFHFLLLYTKSSSLWLPSIVKIVDLQDIIWEVILPTPSYSFIIIIFFFFVGVFSFVKLVAIPSLCFNILICVMIKALEIKPVLESVLGDLRKGNGFCFA